MCTLQNSTIIVGGDLMVEPDNDEDQQFSLTESTNEHIHTEKKIITLCYWAPENVKLDSPTIFSSCIEHCSKHEKP